MHHGRFRSKFLAGAKFFDSLGNVILLDQFSSIVQQLIRLVQSHFLIGALCRALRRIGTLGDSTLSESTLSESTLSDGALSESTVSESTLTESALSDNTLSDSRCC